VVPVRYNMNFTWQAGKHASDIRIKSRLLAGVAGKVAEDKSLY
jgi:hypothetical protein